MDINDTHNKSYFYSFPFWIFVDKASLKKIVGITVNDVLYRVYPLFRSGEDNHIPMPFIDKKSVPFMPGVTNQRPFPFINLSPIPLLLCDGGPGIAMSFGEAGSDTNSRLSQPMDSMRVDILGEGGSNDFVYELLNNIRAITKQWWILKSVDPLVGYLRNEASIKESGEIISPGGAVSLQKIPFGFELPLSQELWDEAIMRTFHGTKPSLHVLEILDAYYYVNANDYRKVVLHASFACEQSIGIVYDALCKNKGVKFRSGKYLSGNDFTKHISGNMKKFTGKHDYKEEHPEHFVNMKVLYDLRGNVAHGKDAEFMRDNESVSMDDALAMTVLSSLTHCIRWLFSVAGLETKD